MRLHANAVAENRPSGCRGLRGSTATMPMVRFLFAILARQMVDQRALPRPPERPSARSPRAPPRCAGKQRLEQSDRLGSAVFNRGDGRAPDRARRRRGSLRPTALPMMERNSSGVGP